MSPLVFPSADAMADNREAGEETTAVDSVATGQGAFGQLAPGSSRLFALIPQLCFSSNSELASVQTAVSVAIDLRITLLESC